jgi:predicted membrane protein
MKRLFTVATIRGKRNTVKFIMTTTLLIPIIFLTPFALAWFIDSAVNMVEFLMIRQ